jgi:hypothetical protein
MMDHVSSAREDIQNTARNRGVEPQSVFREINNLVGIADNTATGQSRSP